MNSPVKLSHQCVQLQRSGLVIVGEPTFDEWLEVGQSLQTMETAVQFWIGDWLNYGQGRAYGEKYAELIGERDYGSLRDYAWVASSVDLSRRRDNLSWSHHREIAPLEPDKQVLWLDKAEREELPRRELRRLIRQEGYEIPPPLVGKYRVIYADPPWQYGSSGLDKYGPAERHYPTMPTEDICALPVGDIAEDSSVLFLWSTSPMMEDALRVMEAWGFDYKAMFVWDKQAHNFGFYSSVRHELVLLATRGSCLPDSSELQPSIVKIKRDKVHSLKPEYFREMIDKMYTRGERIELFARKPADGWKAWGNESGGGTV